MRRLIVLVMVLLSCDLALGARRLRIDQLEVALSLAIAGHKTDDDIAREISAIELTERLTVSTLDRFASKLPLQPRTALALQLLADQSSFLDPPPTELPATAPPSAEDQQRMLAAARAYAVQTWSQLPNFFVNRITTRFDDSAQVLHPGEWAVRSGLHPTNTVTRQITFRNGKEIPDLTANTSATPTKSADEVGLRSWGEFGPAETVVLSDMAQRAPRFSHWEQISGRLAAVFSYEVPREASHYAVSFSSIDTTVVGRTQFGYGGRERSAQQVANIPRAQEAHVFQETPGYHGSLAIDPISGAILRLTIEANLGKRDPLLRAATMVEYGPVTIGDRPFICPLRSMALSIEPGAQSGCGSGGSTTVNGANDLGPWQSPTRPCTNAPVLLINETRFTDYHRLGSTARILSDASAGEPAPAPSADGTISNPASAQPPQPEPSSIAANPPPAESSNSSIAAFKPPATEAVSAPAPPGPSEPVVPEISMAPAVALPDTPVSSQPATASGLTLRVTSRLVDVGLIAYDKSGHPVTDLNMADVELFDDGHKRDIQSLTHDSLTRDPKTLAVTSPAGPSNTARPAFANRPVNFSGVASAPTAPSGAATILLIDESHIAWTDLNNARAQILHFLAGLPTGERIGLYTINPRGFRVLLEPTTDYPALTARLEKFTPSAQSVSSAQQDETRNRQSFEEVHNIADLNSVNGNRNDAPDGAEPVDPQLLNMGSDPARASLLILSQVARHIAALPGHKSLVWVSSDNVFVDWQDQQVSIDKISKNTDVYALRAQEALNEAHAAVYPFDVSQLEGGGIGADIRHRNVELAPAAADNAATAASATGATPPASNRNMQPGRIMAEMNQNLHPIQGSVRDLAAATGGRVVRRSGDLAAQLSSIVADGSATYQLSFSPEGQADDRYHKIEVRLVHRKGITLRYRSGYLFQREPESLKDRFQQAVWRPIDVSEISITADVVPLEGSASVKLNIAGTDLGMEQQANRWMDKLDIFFIQRDDAGIHSHLDGQTLGLRLKPATYQNVLASGVPFDRAVSMQPGMSSLRILVVDENSGRMGSVTIPASSLRQSQ